MRRTWWAVGLVAAALIAGCSSSEGSDASDSGAADARALDGSANSDAANADAAPVDAADAASADAASADATAPDSGSCSAEIPRDQACTLLSQAMSERLHRCQPELPAASVALLAAWTCAAPGRHLDDLTLSYSGSALSSCACSLRTTTCTAAEPLESPACLGVLTGTIANFSYCHVGHCTAGAYCHVIPVSGRGLPYRELPEGCSGLCRNLALPGAPCIDSFDTEPLECVPGYQCDLSLGTPICVKLPEIGQDCSRLTCLGAFLPYGAPTAVCVHTASTAICQPPPASSAPGLGDACQFSIGTATSAAQIAALFDLASAACDVPSNLYGRGLYCVPTGSTASPGVCRPVPALNEACGIGPGLSPRCAPGAYCAAIDPLALAPVSGMCRPTLAGDAPCVSAWSDEHLGDQCALGFECIAPGNRCAHLDCDDL